VYTPYVYTEMAPFDDDFFGDSSFDELVRGFMGGSRSQPNRIIRGEQEDRIIDFIETNDRAFLIFELPGYDKGDVSVNVKNGDIIITARSSSERSIKEYLQQKLREGITIRKILPDFVNSKKFTYSMMNGVLEIEFAKK
jgi:HSP20 family molecular chaperone IbpA